MIVSTLGTAPLLEDDRNGFTCQLLRYFLIDPYILGNDDAGDNLGLPLHTCTPRRDFISSIQLFE